MRSKTTQSAPRLPTPVRTFIDQYGLTKLQMLVALVVIAIIAMVAVPRLHTAINHTHTPEIVTAEQDIDAINLGLQAYKQDNIRYPSQEQGLLALIIKPARPPATPHWKTGGYIERLPRDPWGHSYQYRLSEDEEKTDVFSFGAKGPDAGDDSDTIVRGSKH